MSNIEQFGKYILLEKLAAGGMAEVYLAKSNGANGVSKFVAIKRILPQFSNNEEFIDMFKEEAKVAINLNHSNVVSIYDFGIEKGQFYLVMEFVEGRNLRQILNELKKASKSVSIEQAVFIVKEAAAGLDHAHRCTDSKSGKPLNITHRDMSPQNIMISFEGEAKVIDFGIAKAEKDSEGTKAGTLKGKFAYMSPEQSEGLPIDPRTDVFALGIILWELLANDRLFTGSNEAAILRKVRDCQIPPIRKINPLVQPELERIVTKALAKDKNVRYQTAANLQKDLNRFLNTQYPDFSTQDFSHFIKDCFKNAFAEGREKLLRYGQIENLQTSQNVTETRTAPQQEQNPQSQLPNIPTTSDAQSLKATPAASSEAQLKGLEIGSGKNAIQLDGIRNASLNKNPAGAATLNKSLSSPELGQNTRVTHVTRVSQIHTPKSEDSGLIIKIASVALLCVVSFWGYKTYLSPQSKKGQITQNNLNKVQTTEMSSKSEPTRLNLSVQSEPSGAKIYVNQRDMGQVTPAVVSVDAEKELVITLMKDGYLKYETTKKYSQTSTLTATLQRPIAGGYLNIHVINGGVKPALFINGIRLSEELPIRKYRVPANAEILVRAENAITQLNDEVKVIVDNEKTVDVELILGRNQTNSK